MDLAEAVLAGDSRAIARLITHLENDGDDARADLAQLYPHTGRAHIIGVTGPPGTGKSTLVNQLAKVYRAADQSVAVVAVDPTSPFSGGAILGDRIRMRDLSGDPNVFVRSMATRGSLGGLARATADAIKVLDAAGFDVILVETVGAVQSEVEIAQAAHTVIVVEAPGMGDEVQAIKAGILEIADVFAVNKADREGADRTASTLEMMLDLGQAAPSDRIMHHGQLMEVVQNSGNTSSADDHTAPDWRPPVIKTVALHGDGVSELKEAISDHHHHLQITNELARRNRIRLTNELERILRDELMGRLLDSLDQTSLAALMERVAARELDPYTAAQQLIGGDTRA